jgi:hypothetical protein
MALGDQHLLHLTRFNVLEPTLLVFDRQIADAALSIRHEPVRLESPVLTYLSGCFVKLYFDEGGLTSSP